MKHNHWALMTILLAFALRVYALDAQSLWNDEGTSVALASLSIEAIIHGAARDIHPPLYYLLLHFWMPLAGNTEYAVRFLSVIVGVVIVALVFRIAYFVFDERVALLAALLTALSPFQVYYSQEARMYVWVTLFAAISVYAMMRWLNLKTQISNLKPVFGIWDLGFGTWLIYIAATMAMLYTQYVGAFIVLAENLAFGVWLFFAIRNSQFTIRNSQFAVRTLVNWFAGQLIIGSFFIPWYLFAGGQLAAWPSISEPLDLPTLVWRVLNVFSVGLTLEGTLATLTAIVFGILFLLGWRWTRNPNANGGIVTLAAWTLVPMAAMYIVSLARPAYNPKFLLLATPAFYILAARGLSFVLRPSSFVLRLSSFILCSLIILAGSALSLLHYYTDPRYARDDYRTIVRLINTNVRDGDGLLIDAPGQIDVVRYYLRATPQLFLLPRMRPPEPNLTRADADEMLGKVKRLFAIYYATQQSDPQNIIETRLAENAFKARDEWYGNVRFAMYGIASNPRGTRQTINLRVGNEIILQSYQLDQYEANTGDVLTWTLTWRAEQTPAQRYKVFVHLLDANNQVIAQRDGEPFADLRPTTTWRAGETIVDNYGVFIEPGTPPGTYRVEIGMYRADNGARLRIGEGDHLIVGTVQVK
jgi:4-amino-4-deoxy-L-arabinose transferase-like glycosyltransferase